MLFTADRTDDPDISPSNPAGVFRLVEINFKIYLNKWNPDESGRRGLTMWNTPEPPEGGTTYFYVKDRGVYDDVTRGESGSN